ncbi:D-alanyl-D-alanine carboxypeptidase [Mesorhizobium sp. NBSH29]|uniref:D-alanyl-D-alanine carboxypeptidase family protein n=1 Tax=Mesorhizobium sp. NBSH29 TaxID=2654249 RepID=UPI0018966458|nr:D-alanyl-D-alanine carboxypeptidase family protein [Mesorhizobium sp. NBSH29]QPC86441.1 D-alanyl-D-alanine carboxypeptidase [Mesorhizobium sp. NBSH29]
MIRNFWPALRGVAVVLVLGLLAACSTTETLRPPEPTLPQFAASPKYASIVVDSTNGKTLFQSSSTQPRYPASLTKMMTLYLLFEALEQGRVSDDTQIPVSAYAAARPPSKLGFRAGETITVAEAIQALCTKSANDVAVAVAEHLAGTEDQFAAYMTTKARSLGMSGTVFRNASGLPDPSQVTTARDMALLGMALQRRFPRQFGYFSAREFTFRGKIIKGHNRLLGRVQGVDGIKTGYIGASGFNIVTSVRTGGRGLVVVVMGGESARARDAHVEELIGLYMPETSRRSGGSGVATQ